MRFHLCLQHNCLGVDSRCLVSYRGMHADNMRLRNNAMKIAESHVIRFQLRDFSIWVAHDPFLEVVELDKRQNAFHAVFRKQMLHQLVQSNFIAQHITQCDLLLVVGFTTISARRIFGDYTKGRSVDHPQKLNLNRHARRGHKIRKMSEITKDAARHDKERKEREQSRVHLSFPMDVVIIAEMRCFAHSHGIEGYEQHADRGSDSHRNHGRRGRIQCTQIARKREMVE
mmetsp:Transcript_9030/g.14738  ORF Transcript_9030/g.14738 Transcript_9030/m.14738 type:complete len:228 (+) Transcript_9030:278-961(+)